jgi:hypothetical protein
MNPKIKSLPVPKSPAFTVVQGSPTIRFTGERMSWVLPWSDFGLCVLKANPCCRNPKKQPPQELTLYFGRAEVTLLGWHLDSMLPHLADQNISQILTATKRPKKQTAGVAWIAETFVLPLTEPIPAAAAIGAKQPKP